MVSYFPLAKQVTLWVDRMNFRHLLDIWGYVIKDNGNVLYLNLTSRSFITLCADMYLS